MNLQRHLAGRPALIAAFALLVWGFWSTPLYDLDEGAFTEATREMLASGNYVSIYLNGEPRHDKPILIYWLQAASVKLFGLNEFALRLPSVLASLGWVLVVVAFGRRHLGRETGMIAGVLLCLSLYVGLIARAAVADALLNLFLALALFEIYNYFRQPDRRTHLRVFLWMGLGFLTKGPVAVFFPFVISAIFYLSYSRWRDWFQAILYWPGILLFLVIVLPWHVAVYLDTGWAFFEGFYLEHNVDRYSRSMEGHGGPWYLMVLFALLVVMPFASWLIAILGRAGRVLEDPLDRFVWIWLFVVMGVFSFSGTKLPHYLLYGMTGIFLLMARYRDVPQRAWIHLPVGLSLLALFTGLPQIFAYLARNTERLYEKTLFLEGVAAFSNEAQLLLIAFAMFGLAITFLRIALWQRLLLLGYVQALAVALVVLPNVLGVMQDGAKAAALYARERGKSLTYYRVYQPSVSVYAQQVIGREEPRPGQWVYTRVDKLDDFMNLPSPYQKRVVFSQGVARLVAIEPLQKDPS